MVLVDGDFVPRLEPPEPGATADLRGGFTPVVDNSVTNQSQVAEHVMFEVVTLTTALVCDVGPEPILPKLVHRHQGHRSQEQGVLATLAVSVLYLSLSHFVKYDRVRLVRIT